MDRFDSDEEDFLGVNAPMEGLSPTLYNPSPQLAQQLDTEEEWEIIVHFAQPKPITTILTIQPATKLPSTIQDRMDQLRKQRKVNATRQQTLSLPHRGNAHRDFHPQSWNQNKHQA